MMRLLSFFSEILPLVMLFVGNHYYDIFIGAAAAVVSAIIILIYAYFREGRIARFALFSVALSGLFTVAAWLAGESLFIKIQPTLFNLAFAAALLGGRLYGRPMMKYFFGAQFQLTDDVWRTLTTRWGLFMLLLAVANEVAWRNFSDDGWVTIKVFIIAPATALFMAAQLPITLRGRIANEQDDINA